MFATVRSISLSHLSFAERSGLPFIVYPTLLPGPKQRRELCYCRKCGVMFARRVELKRVHAHDRFCFEEAFGSVGSAIYLTLVCRKREGEPDPQGILKNVAPRYCEPCYQSFQVKLKPPTPEAEAAKDERLRWRRRGADHSGRIDWEERASRCRVELMVNNNRGMTGQQIQKLFYDNRYSVTVQNLVKNLVEKGKLPLVLKDRVRVLVKSDWGSRYMKVNRYALAESVQ